MAERNFPKFQKTTENVYFSPDIAKSSVGVKKCRGSQKTGNYLNYLQKIKKIPKTRFWGRFEQESGFPKSKMADFLKFAMCDSESKSGQNWSKSTSNHFFVKLG